MSNPATIPPVSTGELGSVTVYHLLRQVYPVTHSESVELGHAELVIGRGPGKGGITINDESSSRQHASIRFDGRTRLYDVIDLNSRNGTFVNGTSIQRKTLENGDTIRVGRSIFVYVRGAIAPGVVLPKLESGLSLARALVETIADRAALSQLPILIYGPTGAGKERLASRVHKTSTRSGRLVSLNCGALSSELLGSELFGHVKGAYSGAQTSRTGLFAAADNGTLFLDEIGELPLDQQPALLRACEQGRIRPVGSDRDQDINVRIIAATHKNLDDACASGSFRMDLLARLRGVTLKLPPLTERKDEILMLFSQFIGHLPLESPLLRNFWRIHGRKMSESLRTLLSMPAYLPINLEAYIHRTTERLLHTHQSESPLRRPLSNQLKPS